MKAKIAAAAAVILVVTGLATGMAMSGQGRGDPPPMPWEDDPSITEVCVGIAAPVNGFAPGKGRDGALVDDQGREIWVWVDVDGPPPPDKPPAPSESDSRPVYDSQGREQVGSDQESKGGLDLAAEHERCEPNTPPRRDG